MKDVEILTEFKKRFDKSCLYSWQISSLLTVIGIEHLKTHLKELGYRIVKVKS